MIWLLSKVWPVAVFASLLINEISYKGTPEWVELYNDSGEVQSLDNLILKDGNNSTKDDLYLSGSMAPYEYRVFENTKSWLNDSGDSLMLISSESGKIFDEVGFEKAVEGKTYGRSSGSFVYMDPTKGQANAIPSTPTPTPTKTPTPPPTQSPAPTHTPTPTRDQSITVVTNDAPLPTEVIATQTVDNEPDQEITPEISLGAVLGENNSATPEGKLQKVTEGNDFQKYGYILMIGGSVLSVVGMAVGYLRYQRDGVK